MADKRYFVKESWIFNLESMHDKLYCILMDIEDKGISFPVEICGRLMKTESDIYDFMELCSKYEYIAKSRKVTSEEYGEIKKIVEWRVYSRYAKCISNGMSEKDAGLCFSDM